MAQLVVAQHSIAQEEQGRAALADSTAELVAAAGEQRAAAAAMEVQVADLTERLTGVRPRATP